MNVLCFSCVCTCPQGLFRKHHFPVCARACRGFFFWEMYFSAITVISFKNDFHVSKCIFAVATNGMI